MLSTEQIKGYERDGIVFPVSVLSESEVAYFRANVEELLDENEGQALRQLHFEQRWAYDLGLHPRVLDAVEGILGPNLLVHTTLVFYKPAQNSSFVSWHQDGLYPGLQAPRLTTAWIALTPSVPENGCLRVIPGSHREGILPHREEATEHNLLRQGQTVENINEDEAVDVILQPGQMSLHHRDLIHASNPNQADYSRTGFVIRCITPEAQFNAHPVVAARGKADVGHFDLMSEPPNA